MNLSVEAYDNSLKWYEENYEKLKLGRTNFEKHFRHPPTLRRERLFFVELMLNYEDYTKERLGFVRGVIAELMAVMVLRQFHSDDYKTEIAPYIYESGGCDVLILNSWNKIIGGFDIKAKGRKKAFYKDYGFPIARLVLHPDAFDIDSFVDSIIASSEAHIGNHVIAQLAQNKLAMDEARIIADVLADHAVSYESQVSNRVVKEFHSFLKHTSESIINRLGPFVYEN